MMISAQQACIIVLELHEGSTRDGHPERFVIQFCERSADGDYWIIRCNTEDCVVHGRTEYCYVGVNAYLVEVNTGALETVASCFSVEEYLQDKKDLDVAAGRSYILTPSFSRENQDAVINLRKKLACSYPDSFALLVGPGRQWFTGKRRHIEEVQRLLAREGIATSIELHAELQGAINIGPETWHFDAVLKALSKRRINLCEVGQ
ncbi:hypothetical protein ACF8C1_20430 [Pseudomonas sp. zjy_9]|uniref:hypothetical protein n=1 Tax=Ectopseudomonas khazarica TaxID=2502979 RepID=UPI00370C1886